MNTKRDKHRADCYQCRHFYITWDAQQPRACRAYGFQSRLLPSLAIAQITGESCLQFQPKPPRASERGRARS